MMHSTYVTHTGIPLQLESKPLKRGGEGTIHRVTGGGTEELLAKIWHKPEKALKAHQRLQWMINNSPVASATQAVKNAIIWPRHLLFGQGRFAGFTMPPVHEGIKLFSLIQAGFPQHNLGKEWDTFQLPWGLNPRLVVCYNLAQAVHFLHQTGKFMLVDMKPENILVKPNGHISLIDLDSIQVSEKGILLFPATAFTPEYAPPELHNKKIDTLSGVAPSYDLFSMAVILYQILLAVHPFQASHPKNTTLHENIMQGLWVHGPRKGELHRIPQLHNPYTNLPAALHTLFEKTFVAGHADPASRVTADEWARALLTAIRMTPRVKPRPRKKAAPSAKTAAKKSSAATAPKRRKTHTQLNQHITTTHTCIELREEGVNITLGGNLMVQIKFGK